MAQYDVDLRDYWRIFRKRKMVVLLMVILAGLSSYGFAKLKEPVPVYEAVSSVKIERHTSMADFFTGTLWAEGDNITTQAFIITSFPVLERTAKELNWLGHQLSSDEIRQSRISLSVIQRLKGMLQASPETGTNIINLKVAHTDANEAARVANAFAKSYRDYNIHERNRQTFETRAFIEEQLRNTEINLRNAEEKLRRFKEDYSLVALDAQTESNLARITSVEGELEKTNREISIIQVQLKIINDGLNSPDDIDRFLPAAAVTATTFDYRTVLRDLVIQRNSLLIDFTEAHPQVVELNLKIKNAVNEIRRGFVSQIEDLLTLRKNLEGQLAGLRKENLKIPEKALELARLEREVELQTELFSQLKTQHQEVLIKESGRVEEVTILRPALPASSPINIPSKIMIVATGIVMGLIMGIIFAFIAETLDTSIGTIEDVESLLGVPVLGVIPQWGREEKEGDVSGRKSPERSRIRDLISHNDPKSLAAEAFRSLRTNLQFIRVNKKGKVFVITSSFVQEGKTSNIVNLALSMAQAGEKVLLVEGDLRKPVIHKMFGIQKAPGMTDFVLGNYNWREIVQNLSDFMLGDLEVEEILKTPGLDNLNIITAGTNPPNPSEILRSPRFQEFIQQAMNEYDAIFIDAPPVLPVADATEIATLTDGVILVYKVGAIARGVLNRAKATLDNVNANVLGIILNNVKPEVGPDYFKYHAQYYYGPAKDGQEEPDFQEKNYLNLVILIIAITLLLVGIFWEPLLNLLK